MNTVIPTLLAGNAVILQHMPQTQVVAERLAEAVALMNDSDYGLTAANWTSDLDAARALGDGSRPARSS